MALLQDFPAMLDHLALPCKSSHEKLVFMDIHEAIKRARIAKGWSHTRLAAEVSAAEGLPKPLAWQTVQQWENGKSAPKRSRLALVTKLLGINPNQVDELAPTTKAEEPRPYYDVQTGNALIDAKRALAVSIGSGKSEGLMLLMLQMLGAEMAKQDAAVREAAASLAAHICKDPEHADMHARRLVAMLEVPGKAQAQKSTNSQPSRVTG